MMADNFGHGKGTRGKLERTAMLLPMLVKMSGRWVKQYGGTFLYIEANAGPGEYQDADGIVEGSPVVALRCLASQGIPYHAVLVERDKDAVDRLALALKDRDLMDHGCVEILHADNDVALREVCQQGSWTDRGMVFFDEKGAPKFDLINEVMSYRAMRSIDVMVNIPTVTLKLMRRCVLNPRTGKFAGWQGRADDTLPLLQKLHVLHKKRVLVGEPSKARYAWSLIFGSNWQKFPDIPKRGLYAADSDLGRDCLRRISYSKREREAGAV